jgi:hypothetical protein
MVTQKCQLFCSRGLMLQDQMFSGVCIFYDHSSGYLHVEFQVALNVNKTLEAKLKFKQSLFNYGTIVHNHHSDNGIFAAQAFIKDIEDNFQTIKFTHLMTKTIFVSLINEMTYWDPLQMTMTYVTI